MVKKNSNRTEKNEKRDNKQDSSELFNKRLEYYKDIHINSIRSVYTWLFVMNAGALLAILTSIVSKECRITNTTLFIIAAFLFCFGLISLFVTLVVAYQKTRSAYDILLDSYSGSEKQNEVFKKSNQKEDFCNIKILTVISLIFLIAGIAFVFWGIFQNKSVLADRSDSQNTNTTLSAKCAGGNCW